MKVIEIIKYPQSYPLLTVELEGGECQLIDCELIGKSDVIGFTQGFLSSCARFDNGEKPNDKKQQADSPNYEELVKNLSRENHELSEKVETLLWALGKAKEGEKK